MKIGMAISAAILLLLVGAIYMKTRPNASDRPTSASSEVNLALQTLPGNLPGFGFTPDGGTADANALLAAAKDADRWVRGGFDDEQKVEQSGDVIAQLRTAANPMGSGFLDGKPDGKEFEAAETKQALEVLGKAVTLHINWHLEEAEFDEAQSLAVAQLLFGRQAFEKNTRLKARQRGLAMMKAALNHLGRVARAAEQDGEIDAQAYKQIQDDVAAWFNAITAIETVWNAKLKTTESVNSKARIPNIADLTRIANQDQDKTFRVYAARRLGYALFERGDPGNQLAINEALDNLENDSDTMVAAAAKAGRSIKDRDEYYELRKQPPMQILLLGLFVALFLHDATVIATEPRAEGSLRIVEALPADAWPYLGPLPIAALVLGPKLVLALLYHASCRRTRRRLGQADGQRALHRLEKFSAALPLVLLTLFIGDLSIGALRAVRLVLQHVVLIDELVVLAPTLVVSLAAWWSYYPVDRRLRESVILRDADAGRPVYPLLSRGQYLSIQVRHQFGLLLLPLLAVFAWAESLALIGPDHRGWISANTAMLLTPLGILGVFLLSPLVIRYVWHTAPLSAGEVRDRLLALCTMHKVRIRGLLLWRTGGGMVNAAVTGLIWPVRYILLSDGLLDQVPPRETEAVMAHEIAHVKLRHMLWMALVLVASLSAIEWSANTAIDHLLLPTIDTLSDRGGNEPAMLDLDDPQTRMLTTALPVFGLTMLVFGWVSRRIERQADVFAARHLAQTAEDQHYDASGRLLFHEQAIATMVHALQHVAELNHSPVGRKSWRHGSIAWRQRHLRSLIGRPINDTPVDRVLMRVKIAVLAALTIVVLAATDGGADLLEFFGA